MKKYIKSYMYYAPNKHDTSLQARASRSDNVTQCIKAIEENNNINWEFQARWNSWINSHHVAEAYAIELTDKEISLLDKILLHNKEVEAEEIAKTVYCKDLNISKNIYVQNNVMTLKQAIEYVEDRIDGTLSEALIKKLIVQEHGYFMIRRFEFKEYPNRWSRNEID